MSALASLVRAYDRLSERGEAPAFGYSVEKIGFMIPLNDDGGLAGPPIDLREGGGKKKTPRLMQVPASFKRPGITPRSFFLWDNTAFVLGVSADEKKASPERLEAFRELHRRELADTDDPGLKALLCFIGSWSPSDFARLGWPEEMKDQNVVFALESERRGPGGSNHCIHDRPAARALWARLSAEGDKSEATCLVTGERGPIARLHPAIKGVWDAQMSGASLVSFNLDAFTSYGHEQGENAPVSEAAVFAYTTALNHFLERGSAQRIQIGDASTVFWADGSDAAAKEAEGIFAALLGANAVDETLEAKKVGAILKAVRDGRPAAEFKPDLPQGVRFFVLALAPNASRLSVRFYVEDDFGTIAARFLEHAERMRIEPPPREDRPPIWRLLIETAVQRKSENIQPNLAGDWLRAILTGNPYPLTLLSTVLMRLRADRDVNGRHAESCPNPQLFLGGSRVNRCRKQGLGLFARPLVRCVRIRANAGARAWRQRDHPGPVLWHSVGHAAVGLSLASAEGDAPPLALRKDKPGLAVNLDRRIGEIFELADPDSLFVPTLSAQRQAMFAVGYYHQRNDFYRRKEEQRADETAAAQE